MIKLDGGIFSRATIVQWYLEDYMEQLQERPGFMGGV
jgi:hypothetical protein